MLGATRPQHRQGRRCGAQRVGLGLVAVFVVWLVAVVAWYPRLNHDASRWGDGPLPPFESVPNTPPPQKYLCFTPTGYQANWGRFNNHLIAFVHALFAAHTTGRTPVVATNYADVHGPALPWDELLDMDSIKQMGHPFDRMLALRADADFERICGDATRTETLEELIAGDAPGAAAIPDAVTVHSVDVLFQSRAPTVSFMKRAYRHLRFAPGIEARAAAFVAATFGSAPFAAVHLRDLEGECLQRAQRFTLSSVATLGPDGAPVGKAKGDDAISAVASMCRPEPSWVVPLLEAGSPSGSLVLTGQTSAALFVATDRQRPDLDAEFAALPYAAFYKGDCSAAECVVLDMAICRRAASFAGNPLSTVSFNVARLRATAVPRPQPSVLLRGGDALGIAVPLWYRYTPVEVGDDPRSSLGPVSDDVRLQRWLDLASGAVPAAPAALPDSFQRHSEFAPKATPECYTRIKSACIDQATGGVVVFQPTSMREGGASSPAVVTEQLKTCHRRHCAHLNPPCPGFGWVNVTHVYGDSGLAGLAASGVDIDFVESKNGAAVLTTWTIEGSLWHVILDSIAGFWELVHELYGVAQVGADGAVHCPDFDVVFTNDMLHGRDEARCISTYVGHSPGSGCGKWKDAFGLVFYAPFDSDYERILSQRDMQIAAEGDAPAPALKCYKDVMIGYPPLYGDYHHIDILPDFGSCLLQNTRGVPMRQRRPAASKAEDITVLIYNRAKCARNIRNFDAYVEHIRSKYGHFAKINTIYFEHASKEEQMAGVADADIFIGPHGSAMGWMSVMPIGSVLVVLRSYPNQYNRDFLTWSKWADVRYTEWAVTDPSKMELCDFPGASVEQRRTASGSRVEMYQAFEVDFDQLDERIDNAVALLEGTGGDHFPWPETTE